MGACNILSESDTPTGPYGRKEVVVVVLDVCNVKDQEVRQVPTRELLPFCNMKVQSGICH